MNSTTREKKTIVNLSTNQEILMRAKKSATQAAMMRILGVEARSQRITLPWNLRNARGTGHMRVIAESEDGRDWSHKVRGMRSRTCRRNGQEVAAGCSRTPRTCKAPRCMGTLCRSGVEVSAPTDPMESALQSNGSAVAVWPPWPASTCSQTGQQVLHV